jgi:hypothetical protein
MSTSHYSLSMRRPSTLAGHNMVAAESTWYSSEHFHRYPSKSQVRANLKSVLEGWAPATPIIDRSTRVLALGSCFAANFVEWLIAHGHELPYLNNPLAGVLHNAFENVSVIAQQFRWAFGEFDPSAALWIGKDKQVVEATEERRLALRKLLEETEVLVATLGLSEVWYDQQTGEPLWRVLPVSLHDPSRHAFKVETVADTIRGLETIESIRARYLPGLKILYTVSPLRLRATFRPISAVTANSVSKAILRAALDEFLRSHSDLLNRTYYYFPSYELATDVFVDPFAEDQRHLHEYILSQALDLFARHYTTLIPDEKSTGAVVPAADRKLELIEKAYDERLYQVGELTHTNQRLQERVATLQQACDERLAVIHQLVPEVECLRKACDERLALIHRLSKNVA